jgi:glycosyltransferase involved in cell wall biosynthesis
VQDFNLFISLQEKTIDVWKRKLDWIVEHGGMALLDLHPDYMNFQNQNGLPGEYAASLYHEFLAYVESKYRGLYWHALPREIADFCGKALLSRDSHRRRSVCMLAHTFYEQDNRVTRYAETLVKRGDRVDVFALHDGKQRPTHEVMHGAHVHRVQSRLGHQTSQTSWSYLFPLLKFSLRSSLALARGQVKHHYELIHVHNVPDFLVFAAWFPKLMGAKIILDIHDIVPEFYTSKFHASPRSLVVKLLKIVEAISCKFADHVIVSNHLWREKLVARSTQTQKCSVVLNQIDPDIFYRRKRTRNDGKIIILYPGVLQLHQGLDVAIKAFALIQKQLPTAEFHIYGDGDAKSQLMVLANQLGLYGKVLFNDFVPLRDIPQIIANADLGVVPKRANSFGNEAYSTKIMEFMSQGLPVTVSKTKIDVFYFNDSVVRFFESGNEKEMADAMLTLLRSEDMSQSLVRNASEYVARNNWTTKKAEYLRLVDSLTSGSGSQAKIDNRAGM